MNPSSFLTYPIHLSISPFSFFSFLPIPHTHHVSICFFSLMLSLSIATPRLVHFSSSYSCFIPSHLLH
ncbi:hypothetical protein CSUI_008047, partial [Cystoisospora suis]